MVDRSLGSVVSKIYIPAIRKSVIMARKDGRSPKSEEASFKNERNVLSSDGRRIGQMIGIGIDITTWTTRTIKVKLEGAVIEELNIKRRIFGNTTVSIPLSLVSIVSDVVQLNTDYAGMKGILAPTN